MEIRKGTSNMNLSYGSRGDDVKKLQETLNQNGYNLATDGVYGNNTMAAVRDYQRKNGLSADGIFGSQTSGKLYAAAQNTGGTQQNQADTAQTPKEPDYGKYKYDATKDDAYQKAMAELDSIKSTKPDYSATYDKQLNDIYEKIMNRDKFRYDLNSDMLYQQYKDQYTQKGKQAMMDTMGQAAALTGGYGSTYAQSVGQQQYDAYLQQLNNVIPELYGQALDQYNQEGTNLQNQYSLTADLRDTEYNRYQNALNQYYQEVSNAQQRADTAYDRGYNDYVNSINLVRDDENMAYTRMQNAYDKLVTKITTIGYSPSAQELQEAGMSQQEANSWLSYYQQQMAAASSGSGSGGGSGGRRSSGSSSSSAKSWTKTDLAESAVRYFRSVNNRASKSTAQAYARSIGVPEKDLDAWYSDYRDAFNDFYNLV